MNLYLYTIISQLALQGGLMKSSILLGLISFFSVSVFANQSSEQAKEQNQMTCPGQTLDWGTNYPSCSAQAWIELEEGQYYEAISAPPTTGSAIFKCENGSWVFVSGDCQ